MNRQVPWLRVFVEGVVIVVSILLAFGLQAWWEGRGEAERREALLRGLAADFAGAEALLDTAMVRHNATFGAATRWLLMSRSAHPSPELAAVADTLLTDMYFATISRSSPMGSVDALFSGGDMAVLDSPALVAELTSWAALLDFFTWNEEQGRDQLDREFTPHLYEVGVQVADLVWFSSGFYSDYPIEPEHTDGYLLLDDVRWESIVANRWFAYRDVLSSEKPLRAAFQSIRVLLENELRD